MYVCICVYIEGERRRGGEIKEKKEMETISFRLNDLTKIYHYDTRGTARLLKWKYESKFSQKSKRDE